MSLDNECSAVRRMILLCKIVGRTASDIDMHAYHLTSDIHILILSTLFFKAKSFRHLKAYYKLFNFIGISVKIFDKQSNMGLTLIGKSMTKVANEIKERHNN